MALLEFLKLYGEDLNYNQVGISTVGEGAYFPKGPVGAQRGWRNMDLSDVRNIDRLCLVDPHNPERDVGG